MRRLTTLAAVIIGTLFLTGAAHAATINWKSCKDHSLAKLHAQCGFVSVPLSYSDPTGPQIQLAVSRINHTSTAANYHGVILTNPGGPGGSGYDINTNLVGALKAEHLGAAAADYDWIGFDPRGVGRSTPKITCEKNYFKGDRPNYVPSTPTLLSYWQNASAGYAKACANHSATQTALLGNMTTVDNAKDMDSIRAALGVPTISFYGFSWGTELGQTYATLYPTHLTHLILDSNLNPKFDDYQSNFAQDAPFERNVGAWFAWLAKYNKIYGLGKTEAAVRARYNAVVKALGKHPAGGVVGPDEWTDVFLQAGYYEQTWIGLGSYFAAWAHHPVTRVGTALARLWREIDTPGNDNEFAVYLAVECTDSHWPTDFSMWTSDTNKVPGGEPLLAWNNTWFNAPCITWPAPSQDKFQINGAQVSSALLIDETLDAATPFTGSEETRAIFPHSVLLAEPGGTTHADSLNGDKCVDSTIAAYLTSGTLPRRSTTSQIDKKCAPLPKPVPKPPKKAARLNLGRLLHAGFVTG